MQTAAGSPSGGTSGTAPSGGSGATHAGAAQSGAGGNSTSDGECRESPPLPSSADAVLELPIRFESAGKPLVIGEPAQDSQGSDYRVSQFKVFLSQPAFQTASGSSSSAVFVDAEGSALPYGLYLLDSEDAEPKLRLRTRAGEYTALQLNIGVPAACNGGDPTLRSSPLNADSDMYWTWGSTYLYLRFEGTRLGETASPFSYHLGGIGEAAGPRTARLTADLRADSVAGVNAGPTLVLDVGAVIAPTPEGVVESGPHQIQADWMFEHLEKGAFSLRP